MKIAISALAIALATPAVLPPPRDPGAALQQIVAQRQYEVEREAARHAATLEALGLLRQAEALLATGDSDGVDDDLALAEAALSGRTLLDVQAAREALGREDLLPARQYLAAALAERRAAR
jgi:hypothetical protein